MATSREWYDVGGGWAGMWDGERWTGERISHEQLAELTRPAGPPPPMQPPAPAAPVQRRPLTRRQRNITIGAVAAIPVCLVAFILLSPSKLERAGTAIGQECPVQESTGDRLRFTADYQSIPCLLAIREQLVELGFKRGALEDGADRTVRAGRYRLTTAADPPNRPVVTITAE